jgi:HTH-type transcriptional regulator/antitoxin HigA
MPHWTIQDMITLDDRLWKELKGGYKIPYDVSIPLRRLEILGILIDQYENEHFRIDLPDPIEAIKFRMEQPGYTQTDLAKVVGLKSRASEILNKKRKLSLEMIRQLHEKLNIPTDVLIQDY